MMRFSRVALVGGALIFGLSFSAWAAPVLKEIRFPTDIYEGQKVKVKVTFEWPVSEGSHEIKVPKVSSGANLEFVDFSQAQETYSLDTGDIHRLVLTFTVKPLSKGQGRISGFEIRYKPPADQGPQSLVRRERRWETLSVPPIAFNVKAALPWKKILIFVGIPLGLILPFGLWFLHASRVDRKIEKKFLSDPKQQHYATVVKEFDRFVSGYNRDDLRILLSKWAAMFRSVVATCYDISLRKTSNAELLSEMNGRGIPAGEIREIEDILKRLENVRFSMDGFETSQQVEDVRVSILKYVNGKLIMGVANPD